MNIEKLLKEHPLLNKVIAGEETAWINPGKIPFSHAQKSQPLSMAEIEEADNRLRRFAPLIMKLFPETESSNGIIESPLKEIENMKKLLQKKHSCNLPGRLFLKLDSDLPIAGSVKARGGIYEVLKHTEDLALEYGLLTEEDIKDNSPGNFSTLKLAEEKARNIFSRHKIQVGSTGNLGLSIGIMSSALGYKAIVHMSADAMQWKKDLLRKHGAEVIEYSTNYTEAVRQGRKLSDEDPSSYFVDDENSLNLFLGYACAALRLREQLQDKDIQVDGDHPLFVYIPCGVGGAPGGISYGLKQVYGDSVHCFFVEPVTVPCMLIGLESGLNEKISVYDLGLSGQSQADGLAVGRPSGFVGKVITPYLSGEFTIKDSRLFDYLQDITRSENLFLEPSACAGFHGPLLLNTTSEGQKYLSDNGLTAIMKNSTHIVWATGGNLVPHNIRDAYLKTDAVDD